MNTLLIQVASNPADVSGMDELLWRVLWQPIGLPRQVRRRFLVAGEQIELVAKQDDRLVGGLVAAKTADAEIELRHLAVSASERGRGIGRRLVEALIREAASRGCNRVHTIARNSSAGFFRKLGFEDYPKEKLPHKVWSDCIKCHKFPDCDENAVAMNL